MTRWLSITLQLAAASGQIVNLLESVLNARQKAYVAAVLGIVSLVVNIIAHNSNPDATPAEVAWEPRRKG